MDWERNTEFHNTYHCSKEFNGFTYVTSVFVEDNPKTVRYWVGASSGKKRKDLEVFDDKPEKSLGGIQALLWIKSCMEDFPKWYGYRVRGRKQYICIHWVDSRRRDIYSRLQKEGFRFMTIDGNKTLIKKL